MSEVHGIGMEKGIRKNDLDRSARVLKRCLLMHMITTHNTQQIIVLFFTLLCTSSLYFVSVFCIHDVPNDALYYTSVVERNSILKGLVQRKFFYQTLVYFLSSSFCGCVCLSHFRIFQEPSTRSLYCFGFEQSMPRFRFGFILKIC